MAAGELSPRLQGAVADLDPSIVPAFLKCGATSHVIVANNWDSAEDLVDELGFDAPSDSLTTAWLRCEGLFARKVRAAESPPGKPNAPAKPSTAFSSPIPQAMQG